MHEQLNFEHRLSVLVSRYCSFLDEARTSAKDITSHFDLCFIDFPFDNARFLLCLLYTMTDLKFETRAYQTHLSPAARMVIEETRLRSLSLVLLIVQFGMSV